MSNAKLPLLGVKATLKRVAVKLEFCWHGLSDEDSIIRSASERCESVLMAAPRSHKGFVRVERRIMAVVVAKR